MDDLKIIEDNHLVDNIPEFSPGDTVKVVMSVKRGDRDRLQRFEGIVIKIKGSSNHVLDVERIQAVRQAVGGDVELRLDPNAAWDVNSTIHTMKLLEDCSLQLLEQPLPAWDLKGMAHIRNNITLPLMADESIWTPQDAIKISEYGAADLLNIKIAKSCGLHLGKKIEYVAESLGLPCIAGTEIEPGFSMVAKLHLAASMKIHPLASEFTELSLLKKNILNHKIEIINGCVKVPDKPGFGVELNEDILNQCKYDSLESN